MYRYAVYFAPASDNPCWQMGSSWLGRDARSSAALSQPQLAGIVKERQQQLTGAARRYGWHATVKAPFRLAQHRSEAQLRETLADFCRQHDSLPLKGLQPGWLDHFLALHIPAAQIELQDLVQRCVSRLDHLRAPPDQAELQRRRSSPLSDRQLQLLTRWGYPHTEEQYRFHLTLSATITDPAERATWQNAAHAYWAGLPELSLDRLCLFGEASPDSDFVCLAEYPLARSGG